MCARVQTDVLRVLRVLRVPVFQFCTCLWRHVFGVLRVLCVLLGLCVLCALCALYAFSKPYVQHHWPRKRASGQKRTDGRQRNIFFSVVKWYTVGRVLPNLQLHGDYHQRVKKANHSEHPIVWLIVMDNVTPMRWTTSLQNDLLKIQLRGYWRSSGTSIGRVTLFERGRGNPWNTSAVVSNLFADSMRRGTDRHTNMNNNGISKNWMQNSRRQQKVQRVSRKQP